MERFRLPLWDGDAPLARDHTDEDIPRIDAYLCGVPGSASIIIFPGGGYIEHAPHEAGPVAEWLVTQGINAFVLYYRLTPRYVFPAQFIDGHRAMRLARAHAQEWGIDPQRIGVLGFSAGAHLASNVATWGSIGHPEISDPIDLASSRPALQILIYPVITLVGRYTWCCEALLGKRPSPELRYYLSNEFHVTPATPPTFLAHPIHDDGIPIADADGYVARLHAAGVSHRYIREPGWAHSVGMHPIWAEPCRAWLRSQGFTAEAYVQGGVK